MKVSGDDLEYLSPGVDPPTAARALGVPVALITLGGDGALVVTADDEYAVAAPKITARGKATESAEAFMLAKAAKRVDR